MIVHYSPQTGLRLQEPEDFRKFKVVLSGTAEAPPTIEGVTFIADDHALVDIDLVPRLPGAPVGEDGWMANYRKMLDAAEKYGWIDAEARAVKAHVERE